MMTDKLHGNKNDGELLLLKGLFEAGVSNMMPTGQNQPGKDPIMSHLTDLEYVKDCIDFRLLAVVP